MTTAEPQFVASAANALFKDLRRLAHDSTAYRRQGRLWLEGDHLCRAALERGVRPAAAVFAESFWTLAAVEWSGQAERNIVVSDALFAGLSALESPSRMGFVVDMPHAPALQPGQACVVLDRVQDAGNVGAILRSAAAFGFRQVAAITGTAALWSPKVLRAGMGAHFGLCLVEGLEPAAMQALDVPLIMTSSHQGELLHKQQLPWPCAWALGHEGQGVSEEIARRAHLIVRIAQPGGEESLNVASAAAICLHASATARQT
ncbi:MAG: RNA methyltransferase [Ramlibacter sp.]|nr:RNA methyltransferase [Ramlibacter sp.]